ncbi:M48 family metallopeptidase [Chitinophaga varians]|uniref:M48 family metallopeptidase n=1 Tax=Chitinophaga varians TaxID=2202339 RepID=A0A847RRF8_9BACT|nr:M48 family metallopeptidase [Chitinophaga varians]NLR65576.1 M48 family metallopeptidase [Chitinophaga varians]
MFVFTRCSIVCAITLALASTASAQFKLNSKTIGAGVKAAKAVTLSDDEVIKYTKEYIQWMDEHNPVAPADDPLAQRLAKLTANAANYEGMNLNFKVYLVRDINAFACADGSVRVCAGLMKVMTDDEVMGVIGHEIGHVKNKDSKDAFKTALMTSALKDGVSSQGGAAGALSDSQLGDLGEAVANSAYSRGQESQADNYGYDFLKANKLNPWGMSTAFEKLWKASQEANNGEKKKKGAQLFSSHPDTEKRMVTMAEKATKDGYKKP